MKKQIKIFYCNVSLLLLFLLLVGCTTDTNNEAKKAPSQQHPAAQSKTNDAEGSRSIEKKGDESEPVTASENTTSDAPNQTYSKEKREDDSDHTSENDNKLTEYSSEEIEYARIWLQLGIIKEIDELNVRRITSGEPINPEDKTSINYPENVIQLSGSRLVDGSVTYSDNGNGTINVYNIPLRWDGDYPAGEKFYKNIIANKKQVQIDPGVDKKVIDLINKINIH